MTQLTTPRRFVLSAVLALGACFEEDFDPFLPYTTSTGSSSGTGSGTADSTSTGDALMSLPDGLAVEPDAAATGCPSTFCVKGYTCGTCCDGAAGSGSGSVSCCEQGSSYSAPSTGGGCEAPAIAASCVEDAPDGVPSRRTPTACPWPAAPTCPPGYHIDAPSFVCNYCSQTGQDCTSPGTCEAFCGGQYGH